MSKRQQLQSKMAKCAFSDEYKKWHDINKSLRSELTYVSCPLRRAILERELDEIIPAQKPADQARIDNVDKLFNACSYFKIPRIWIGSRELVGADDAKYDGWPAIWRLKEVLNGSMHSGDGVGFAAGCGNHDQSQTQYTELFVPSSYVDKAWDVKTRDPIDASPFYKNMVVSKHRETRSG